MSIEEKLLRWKNEMKELQSSLDNEKGALETIYSSLSEELKLKKKQKKELIEKEAKKRLSNLNEEFSSLKDQLEELIEEIEEEMNEEE